jgi:hypothetical protein
MFLDLGQNQLLDFFDSRLITLVESPLLDALGAQEAGADEDFQVLARSGLTDAEFPRDEDAADTVLHKVPINLRREMRPRVLKPA